MLDAMKKLLIWNLALYSGVPNSKAHAMSSESSNSDNSDNSDNSNSYSSICNIHGHFANKVMEPTPQLEHVLKDMLPIRMQKRTNVSNKKAQLQRELDKAEKNLFKGHKDFKELKIYLTYIAELVEEAKIRRIHETGFCGEATAATMVNSLLRQLQTGERQTVQEIVIRTRDGKSNHAFVLYNSEILQSQEIDNNKLKTLFSSISSPEAGNPEICDEFDGFHGDASKWADKFFGSNTHTFGKDNYAFMQVTDFSLPSLGKYNSGQRKYIKNLLKKMLSEVPLCNSENNMEMCPMGGS
ncbi:hypothetical protein ACNVED_15440 (plasmid) [Legionella sp. D16C41]|uniref:hypothetical protein n=1 Tax=Legionella sp. D16C41 TaxID=3402688 RepID=UPI003AF8E9DE